MKSSKLTVQFTFLSIGFIILTILFSSFLSYMNQMNLYQKQREESIQYVASYLNELLLTDGKDFAYYQEYFLDHYKEMLIPHAFTAEDIPVARKNYENLFAQKHPGKVLGLDINFSELDEEVKLAYATYNHEYYLDKFEKARQHFDLSYVEYVVPFPSTQDDSLEIMYTLDSMRDAKIIGEKKYIELGITVTHKREEHEKEFEAWFTGKRPEGYDTFDNQYGKTYAYYSPVIIDGKNLGVIGVEVEIASVNQEILYATIRNMIMISIVVVIFVFLLLQIIKARYIRKLIKLQDIIEEYSRNKNPKIAEELKKEVTNKDEISTIMSKFSDMIYELELYIQSLKKTRKDLQDTKQQAIELNELALKDPLTGIRNKLGYDKEVQKVEWEMATGLKELGVAMVDLNFLKQINDTYGHDNGNVALIRLSKILCNVFEHSPVFRIGGDEFVIILKDHDLENIDDLIIEFKRKLQELKDNPELEYWEKISAAIGYAIYNPEIDSAFDNIFRRADKSMYANKKEMKAVRE